VTGICYPLGTAVAQRASDHIAEITGARLVPNEWNIAESVSRGVI